MNRISGRILRDDNHQGLSDVIVVAYDIDVARLQTDRDPSEENDPGANPISPYFRLLYGGTDTEEDPLLRTGQPVADRLGSVITGAAGDFELSYDETAFRVGDQEARPDLLLLILAPDRQSTLLEENNVAISMGTPEHMRIMHMSVYPTRNAGREEQVLIRIPLSVLRRFGVDQASGSSTRSFIASLAQAESQKKALKSTLARQVDFSEKAQRQRALVDASAHFFVNLSGISASLRGSSLFVGPGDDARRAARQARTQGVNRIRAHAAPTLTASRLRVSEDDLQRLGIIGHPDLGIDGLDDFRNRLEDAGITLPLDPVAFCQLLQEKIGGAELVRTTQLLDEKRAEARARLDALNATSDDNGGDSGGGDSPSEEEVPVEQQIRRLVLAQVASMQSSEGGSEQTGQADAILHAFEQLKPPASPADVTAFHDINHLQIAFPDVWSEAFDRDVSDLMRTLHIEYRTFEEEFGSETDEMGLLNLAGIDPDELQDVTDYTAILRGARCSHRRN